MVRRPSASFCTHTGDRFKRRSPLDWAEAGGQPGRANCLEDPLGEVFGEPARNRSCVLSGRPLWQRNNLFAEQEPHDDKVVSVQVVNGLVVAVTKRGALSILDSDTGGLRTQGPLLWPGPPLDVLDVARSVQHPPAFIGPRGVVVAPVAAVFRDLSRWFDQTNHREERNLPKTVEPSQQNRLFRGPPLTLGEGDLAFCLLEGPAEPESPNRFLLRFFSWAFEEVDRVEIESLARPPIYDKSSQRLFWLTDLSFVGSLKLGSREKEIFVCDMPTRVRERDRPTFVLASTFEERQDLWFADSDDQQAWVCRASVDDVLRDNFAWRRRSFGSMGQVDGLAVGLGSRSRGNLSGTLLALASDRKVAIFDKNIESAAPRSQVIGQGARLGSWDPPIICSAGVLARVQGKLALDARGTPWPRSSHATVDGRYDCPQGLALFGRRVYFGHGFGVCCHEIRFEDGGF